MYFEEYVQNNTKEFTDKVEDSIKYDKNKINTNLR